MLLAHSDQLLITFWKSHHCSLSVITLETNINKQWTPGYCLKESKKQK